MGALRNGTQAVDGIGKVSGIFAHCTNEKKHSNFMCVSLASAWQKTAGNERQIGCAHVLFTISARIAERA